MAEGGFEMDDAAAVGAAGDDLGVALGDEETSFIDPAPINAEPGAKIAPLRQENLREAVNDYYDTFAKDGLIPFFIDYDNFGTTERADQIEREIQNAEDQLRAVEDSIDALDQKSRPQIRQIRDSLLRVLDKNTTLAERVRTLFREQGVTIASILTAIGMAISTLVLTLTGGSAAAAPVAPTPAPPADKAGLKEWAKKNLQALGRMLAQLAGKAAAALPGIIGSILSWLLNLLSKTAGWFAENLWAFVAAIGGLLLVFAREWLLP